MGRFGKDLGYRNDLKVLSVVGRDWCTDVFNINDRDSLNRGFIMDEEEQELLTGGLRSSGEGSDVYNLVASLGNELPANINIDMKGPHAAFFIRRGSSNSIVT